MTDTESDQPEPGSTELEAARALANYQGFENVPETGPLPDDIWQQVRGDLGL